ncbi:unnamed protein product [Durusdinium trenchii]|uniref:Pentatricopeptide repeat-containing protein, chloroplastic n=1 Tax=Durusdinium trenchii TaxID=1381693 RepID=A0ABP0LAQ5_9DINO
MHDAARSGWSFKLQELEASRCTGGSSVFDVQDCNSLIGALGRSSGWSRALQSFRIWRSRSKVSSYNSLVAAQSGNQWREALQTLEEARERQVQIDLFTWTPVIKHCQAGRWKAALGFLTEVRSSDLRLDTIIYGATLDATAGAWLQSLELYHEMGIRSCKRDFWCYQPLCHAWPHALGLQVDEAVRVAAMAVARGHAWRLALFLHRPTGPMAVNAVMGACQKAGVWEWVLQIREGAIRSSLRLSSISYCLAISATQGVQSLWVSSLALHSEMVEVGLGRNHFTDSAVLPSLPWHLSLKLLEDMPCIGVQRNVVTHSASFNGLPWALALQQLHAFPATLNTILLTAGAKAVNQWQRSSLWLLEAYSVGLRLDSEAQTALHGWRGVFELLPRDALVPTTRGYALVMGECEDRGQWEEAWKLLSQMGPEQDVICYNSLLAACTQAECIGKEEYCIKFVVPGWVGAWFVAFMDLGDSDP